MNWRARCRTSEYAGIYSTIAKVMMWQTRAPKRSSKELDRACLIVRDSVERLPNTERMAISLWLAGATQQSIADQLGRTQACVSIAAKRGMKKVRRDLEAYSIVPQKLW